MLHSLSAKNFALIQDAHIEFGPGLNVLTGETGAGKSIILGALTMVIGERASIELIRSGADKAILEGTFDSTDQVNNILAQEGIEPADQTLVIRRELSVKGQNRCFVNDNLVTMATLKSVGDALVDLHGQHEHQSLLRVSTHLPFVDAYGNLGADVQTCRRLYEEHKELAASLQELLLRRGQMANEREKYTFQLKEIDEVNPIVGEDVKLIEEERLATHAEKLSTLTDRVYKILYDSDNSVSVQLGGLQKDFDDLRAIDQRISGLTDQFDTIRIAVDELARSIGTYIGKITFDAERLEQTRQRLLAIQKLKKKYGEVSEILRFRENLQGLLENSDHLEEKIRTCRQRVVSSLSSYLNTAHDLSQKRQLVTPQLRKDVIRFLRQLGMSNAEFEIRYQSLKEPDSETPELPAGAGPVGIDNAEFLLSANAGEPTKPLAKIASGGEISRIMLALKSVLANADRIPTLVFDEIDVGISGRIAHAVGDALDRLAQAHQVICITHLPQIAGFAAHHFVVEKQEKTGRVSTQIRKIDGDARLLEVARLLGGREVSQAALDNARNLIHHLN